MKKKLVSKTTRKKIVKATRRGIVSALRTRPPRRSSKKSKSLANRLQEELKEFKLVGAGPTKIYGMPEALQNLALAISQCKINPEALRSAVAALQPGDQVYMTGDVGPTIVHDYSVDLESHEFLTPCPEHYDYFGVEPLYEIPYTFCNGCYNARVRFLEQKYPKTPEPGRITEKPSPCPIHPAFNGDHAPTFDEHCPKCLVIREYFLQQQEENKASERSSAQNLTTCFDLAAEALLGKSKLDQAYAKSLVQSEPTTTDKAIASESLRPGMRVHCAFEAKSPMRMRLLFQIPKAVTDEMTRLMAEDGGSWVEQPWLAQNLDYSKLPLGASRVEVIGAHTIKRILFP